ncbi:phosphoesterase [Spirosoma montaniterrae]|uniref:Phosphoesterase n=2 Tax=Spirosoma montaniterrae TaxID=1178516 RepID=A0A1P9X4U5_9BACT|nr:phosphoesterase [Spirosoma montaniterrae]
MQPDDAVTPAPSPGKTADQFSADVATKWANLQLKLAQTTAGNTPPITSRAFGYAGLTLYEATVPGMPANRSLAGQLTGLTALPNPEAAQEYHWALSANAAEAIIVRGLWANTTDANKKTIDSLETALASELKTGVAEAVVSRSTAFGKSIGEAIFNYSKTDGGHEGYTRNFPGNYVVPTGAGLWRPTSAQLIPMQPTWGNNRTFVRINATTDPVGPLTYSTQVSSPFFAQALEVYATGKNLTAEQKAIALFWSDDPVKTFTPPGHGLSIATQVLQQEKANLAKAAETYAKVGLATTDAFICCWRCKYKFNLLRPVTYINQAIDPAWKPLLATPPFPEYTSGHSSGSAAVATVLEDMFGANYAFTDRSHEKRGLGTRSFKSFREFSTEAALSRLYGGIHFRHGNEQGLANGQNVAKNVLALGWKK